MRLSELPAFWQEHIKQNDKLGIRVAAYAKRHSLDIKQYYYWRKRLINERPSRKFGGFAIYRMSANVVGTAG